MVKKIIKKKKKTFWLCSVLAGSGCIIKRILNHRGYVARFASTTVTLNFQGGGCYQKEPITRLEGKLTQHNVATRS